MKQSMNAMIRTRSTLRPVALAMHGSETAGRVALALREKILPGDWLTFDTRCRLGTILLDRKNFAAAEPLLLSGYAGMKDHEALIPIPNRSRLTEAVQTLVRLYGATGRPDRAADWKKKGGP